MSLADLDLAIGRWLARWEPRVGPPTCGAGCSRCCIGTAVDVSSADVGRVLDALPKERRPRLEREVERRLIRLRRLLGGGAPFGTALAHLVSLGPCVFLEDDRCGVYEHRPVGCRAWYVWHHPRYCARPGYESCVPAELAVARLEAFYRDVEGELALGRTPFAGGLLVVLGALLRDGAGYREGADLRAAIAVPFVASELVRFFGKPGDDVSTWAALREERDAWLEVGRREAWPYGQPRAQEVRSRAGLRAFRLRAR